MESLQNHFIIAMPNLEDPFFQRSVTYICEHNDEGAMGVVINHPIDVQVADLLQQLEIKIASHDTPALQQHVYAGGPLARDRGFVLHRPSEKTWRSSLQISPEVVITTSTDVLEDIAAGDFEQDYLITLGYAGWEAGQLEQELADNSWLTCAADAEVLFNTTAAERWQKAAAMLGIDVWQLAPGAGHA
ncbi:YqgE/AlgH family protein [Pseudidiomarina taiwanensis]|uniref:UPF0301 protein CWI83_09465 n=1 Tax=Pseudidiomarina taiwanensis TaxID=337250 RepID=A0A432ZCW6_9GAMM|nr:YqgE/AlgH family protein [Pseudidiomarina taiwanensis]RUO75740.1 YqgE/AlgH family protein [Pseudidiomarina taiwanensis]